MTGKGRITKKKLKQPDEFITLTERSFIFVRQYLKPIGLTAGVVVLVILAVLVYGWWSRAQEARAAVKFQSAIELYQKAMNASREGTSAEFKGVLQNLDELLRQLPRTSSGKIALLYKGNIHLRMGEFQEAIQNYEALLGKSGLEKVYASFAMEGLGYAYEGKKEDEKALQAFRKVLEKGEPFQAAETHLNIGRLCEKLGKPAEALESYQAYLKAAKGSPKAQFVLRKISILEK
jgi:tetratricopeptide (TPR) repeat protein